MATRWETVFVQEYGRLVRAAYVVDAANPSRQNRWWRAHRLVHSVLPLRAVNPIAANPQEGYYVLLARVLNRSMHRRKLWRPRPLSRLARMAPPPGGPDHVAVDQVLSEIEPQGRAAYLLLVTEGMDRKSASGILQMADVPDGYVAVNAALQARDRLEAIHGLDVERQADLLDHPAMNPTIAHVAAPAPASLRLARLAWPVLAGLAALVVLAGAAAVAVTVSNRVEPSTAIRIVAAEAWRGSAYPVLWSWPTRGEAAGDRTLTSAAVLAWRNSENLTVGRGADSAPPVGAPQVLFAGQVDGSKVVLMTDKARMARFVQVGERQTLELSPIPGGGVAGASALKLHKGRYLLAPWVTKAQTGTIDGTWRDVDIRDGITTAVAAASGPCYNGPLLKLTTQDVALAQPVTLADLGHIGLVHMTVGDPGAPKEADAPSVWQRLGCQLSEWQGTAVVALHAWEFWSGQLPGGGGQARWACLRGDLADGNNQIRTVLIAGESYPTALARGTRLCSGMSTAVAAGTWWRAPSGGWYLLVAGSSGVDRIETVVGVKRNSARTFVTAGPFAEQSGSVTVTARGKNGTELPILGVVSG